MVVFSNFSAHGFELDGKWWPTSEHYFQAQKFVGTPHMEEIVEDSPINSYWGCGADRLGKNRLGVILMEVRKQLRREQELT